MKVELLNGANLAFIGDAYYELMIRKYLIEKGITNQKELHKNDVKYVSASGHYKIYKKMEEDNFLTEEEMIYFKRGRNHDYHVSRRNLNLDEYLTSSGFEAVIGFLFLLDKKDRLKEIIDYSIKVIEDKNE